MDKLRQDICLGSNLRKLRNERKLTQEQVVARLQLRGCEITRGVYSRYETGELNIKVSHLVALTQVFECDFNAMFEGL